MAVEIGALRALLSLDSAAFEKGAKRAQASMGNLQKTLSKTADNMQRIGRSMTTRVTAPLVAATGLLVRSSIQNAVEIERMAKLANAGTTEFQKFAAGAKSTGVEQDKLADILKDVNDKIGDFAATGGGPMADFFENIAPKVGVTAEQFAKLSGPEALQLYVSSLEKAGVNQQEMTFYMEALASDATLLLPLLRDNGKEMERLGRRAEELGVVMDEKTIKSLTDARGSMAELSTIGRALGNELTAALAPALQFIAEKLADAAKWFQNLSPEMKNLVGAAAVVAAAVGPLAIALGFVAAGLAALASPIGLVVLAFGAVAGVAAYVAANWDDLIEKYPWLEEAATRVGNAFSASWSGIKEIVSSVWTAVSEAINGIVALFQGDFETAIESFKASWQAVKDAISASVDRWLNIINAIVPGFKQVVLDIVNAVAELPGKLLKMGQDAVQAFVDGITTKWAELKETVRAVFDLNNVASPEAQAAAAANMATQAMQDAAATASAGFPLIGADMGQGMANELRNKAGEVNRAAEDVVEGAEGAAREKSKTQSPSRVWMDLGRDLMDGLALGIDQEAVAAAESASAAAARVSAAASTAAPAISAIPDTLRDTATEVSSLNSSFASMFSSAAQGAQSLSEFLAQIGQQLANMFITDAFNALFGVGGGGGSILGSLFSFDGGGYTGAGARSGGVDGKGGFPAILHPNETVIDHTKGQSMGGGVVLNFAPVIDARGADASAVARIEQQQRQMAAEFEGRVHGVLRTGRNTRRNKVWSGA